MPECASDAQKLRYTKTWKMMNFHFNLMKPSDYFWQNGDDLTSNKYSLNSRHWDVRDNAAYL